MAKVIRFWRLHFPYSGRPRDMLRGALVGAVLLAAAAPAVTWSWGYAGYGLEEQAVGFTASEGPARGWAGAVLGAGAAGAALGALVAFVCGAAWEERGSAAAVVATGVLCGTFAGFAWASVVARDHVVEVRAGPPATAPARATSGVMVQNGQVRLAGNAERRRSTGLAAFLVLCGGTVGALAGRGLMGTWPAGERFARPAERGFQVVTNAGSPPAGSTPSP